MRNRAFYDWRWIGILLIAGILCLFALFSDAVAEDTLFPGGAPLPLPESAQVIYVPEPSGVLLFGMGLLGIFCVLLNERRRLAKK